MINTVYGGKGYKRYKGQRQMHSMVVLADGMNRVCTIQAHKLSDALLVAQIVSASIEIDEIPKQDNRAHE